MFGLWFLDSDISFMSITARLCASVVAIVFFLPWREISHIWMSHVFSGMKFNAKSYPLFDFFDPIGALFMLLFGYGWSKRYPYFVAEPSTKSEYVLVCLSGPAFTFFSAVLLGIVFNILTILKVLQGLNLSWFMEFVNYLIEINVVLTVINLMPVPPLDGFKICEAFIPSRFLPKYYKNYFTISIVLCILLFIGVFNAPLEILGNAVYKSVRIISGIPFFVFRGLHI